MKFSKSFIVTIACITLLIWSPWLTKEKVEKQIRDYTRNLWAETTDTCGSERIIRHISWVGFGYSAQVQFGCEVDEMKYSPNAPHFIWLNVLVSPFMTVHIF